MLYLFFREQAHYRKLRHQYKLFLEEDRRRQERNESILRTLERIESRASILAAKTERYKFLRKQYSNFINRLQNIPKNAKIAKDCGTFSRYLSETIPKQEEVNDNSYITGQDIIRTNKRNDMIEKYFQSLNTAESRANLDGKTKQRYPFSNCNDYLKKSNALNNISEGYRATSVADEILESIYAKRAGQDENCLINNTFTDNKILINDEVHGSCSDEFTQRHQSLEQFGLSLNDNISTRAATENVGRVLSSYQKDNDKEKYSAPQVPLFDNNNRDDERKNHTEIGYNSLENGLQNDREEDIFQNDDDEKMKNIVLDEVTDLRKEEFSEELKEVLPEIKKNGEEFKEELQKIKENEEEPKEEDLQYNTDETKETEHIPDEGSNDAIEKQLFSEAENDVLIQQQTATTKEDTGFVFDDDSYKISIENKNIEHQQGENNETQEETVQEHNKNHEESINKHSENETPLEANNDKPLKSKQITEQYNNENLQYEEKTESFQENNDNNNYQQPFDNGVEYYQKEQCDQIQEQQYYDENGQYFQQYDENGQPLQQYYDENGQLVQQYDENGQPYQQYDMYAPENQIMYDENGEVIQQYDNYGQPIQYEENAQLFQQNYDEQNQQQYYGYELESDGQPKENDEQTNITETVQNFNEDAVSLEQDVKKQEDLGTVEKLSTLEAKETVQEASNPEQVIVKEDIDKPSDDDVKDERKPHKVMEMLDTDTENSQHDTKESHDSDFDFSSSHK